MAAQLVKFLCGSVESHCFWWFREAGWWTGIDGSTASSWNLLRDNISPSQTMSTNLMAWGCRPDGKVSSLASISLNNPQFIVGMPTDGSKATAAPHLTFAIPGIMLNSSSLIASIWNSEWGGDNFYSLTGLLVLVCFWGLLVVFLLKLKGIKILGFVVLSPPAAGIAFGREWIHVSCAFSSSIISASFWPLA